MSAAISTSARLATANELLERTLERLWLSISSDIKSFSELDDAGHPVPGTLDEDFVDFIVEDLQFVREIEAHVGFTRPHSGPTWFDDLIERRGAWEGSVL